MNPSALKKFNDILLKDFSSLTAADIIFLRARRDYLTDAQREKYATYLAMGNPVIKQGDESTPRQMEEKKPVGRDLTKMSYKELQKLGKEIGIMKVVGLSKKELIEKISNPFVF